MGHAIIVNYDAGLRHAYQMHSSTLVKWLTTKISATDDATI